ncbi:MAG: hypothetical protein BWY73_00609 [candidate division TA06 bacterium ADurb.Bin417]|uniref:Uncharacterized protein n=1 Tax=candidate division TA06 bacterium ADurb.Bin417 TaxID=1852828 RepID=A0A1V5MHW3_UNCT6|nr:MAG: hypothetical protein BWY73_00609 [candidate division TA06 bacterium ADurb.Bin417]
MRRAWEMVRDWTEIPSTSASWRRKRPAGRGRVFRSITRAWKWVAA